MNGELAEVQCPSCFEPFSILLPEITERPTTLDYDCEVCCRPMFIHIDPEGYAHAESLED